jgi:histidine triad (HIT) family protein
MSECIFCKIIRGEIPSKKVYEDDEFFAFNDLNPQAPVHVLLVPKKHIESLLDLEPADSPLMGRFLLAAKKVAEDMGLKESGARFVFNAKGDAGQTVPHIHCHILGGKRLDDGFGAKA